MALINKKNILEIESKTANTNISLYIPMYRADHDEKNRIAFKNAVQELELYLKESGFTQDEIKSLVRPIKALGDEKDFFQNQSDGLAVFSNEEMFQYFELNEDFEPSVTVGNHFYFVPLTPLLDDKESSLLMTVSPNKVRLIRFTECTLEEIDLTGKFPENVEESHWHVDENKTLQNHSADSTIHHGHGANKDVRDERIKRFFRDVEAGLEDIFRNETSTLYLAGVDHTVHLFKESFSYQNISNIQLSGNFDKTPALELHERIIMAINPEHEEHTEKVLNDVKEMLHTEKVKTQLPEIVKNSIEGNIDTLVVHKNERVSGAIDMEHYKVHVTTNDGENKVDLINRAVVNTLKNGGEIIAIDEPINIDDREPHAVAVLRHSK